MIHGRGVRLREPLPLESIDAEKNSSAVGLVDDAEEAGIARHEIPAAIGEWLHGDAVAKYDVVADDAAGVSEDTVPGNRRARAPGPGRRS